MPTPITKDLMVEVGIVLKTHGTHGTVRVFFGNGILPINVESFLFVKIEGMFIPLVPLYVEKLSDEELFYRFYFIDNIDKAKQIVKKFLYLPYSACKIIDPTSIGRYLEGYALLNEKKVPIGQIKSVIPGKQTLFEIENQLDKVFYLPAVKNLILHIDRLQQKIVMQIPKEWEHLYEQ